MTLGNLIDTLAALPAKARVRFDNGRVPTGLCSWRGVYAELTLDSDNGGDLPTVKELLKDAKAADGKTFEGYKGGDFTMGRHTPVWADEYGDYSALGISGIEMEDGVVVLKTMDLSDYR